MLNILGGNHAIRQTIGSFGFFRPPIFLRGRFGVLDVIEGSMLMEDPQALRAHDSSRPGDRGELVRYAVLTLALFVPLLLAFCSLRNLYPFAASTMMLGDRDMLGARDYYVLRGETINGQLIDLPPIKLTNAMTGRNWSLVSAAVENKSFNIRSLHPANVALAQTFGGADRVPAAARLAELLRAWGDIYNSRLPTSSNEKLRSVRLDRYRWEGGLNGEYGRFVESWTATF